MNTREVIEKLLKSRGVTVAELARRTRTVPSTLYSILNGANEDPRDKTLAPYANYFDIELAQIRGYAPIDGVTKDLRSSNEYPVIEESNIDTWLESGPPELLTCLVRSANPKGARTFVYVAHDSAMSPIIPEGKGAFVDPDFDGAQAAAGPIFVLIEVNGLFAYRMRVDDLGEISYRALAKGYRSITEHQCRIIGYVTGIPEANFQDINQSLDILNVRPQ